MKLSTNYNDKKGDVLFLIIVILISLFGVVMVYSASNYFAQITYNDKYYFVKKQLIGFFLGLICMFLTSKMNYYKIFKYKTILLIIAFVLLILVFTPLGVESYGAKRWLGFLGVTIQPSELAKFFYIIFVAGYFGDKPSRIKSLKGILIPLIVGVLMCLLIMLEPNMSITICVCGVMIALLFALGVKLKYLIMILVPALLLIPVLIILEPYRLKRLLAFLNPWASPKGEGYQLLQSLYALGSGGFFGVGLFNSRQKFRFLPFAESDFILSVIGEELGFFGTFILFLIILFLCFKGYKISLKCKDVYSFLLSFGIITIYIIQVIVNALVVTGSIPPTGLPLPLISSGNTSLIVFMSAFGLVYNISKNTEKV